MLWCSLGNTAPYHITQPSTDNDVQIVSPTATMATLTCSLNVTISSSVVVFWIHNNTIVVPHNQSSTAGSTTTLTIGNLRSSDAGVYQCAFSFPFGGEWILRRNIILLITGMLVTKWSYGPHIASYILCSYITTADYGLLTICCWIPLSH